MYREVESVLAEWRDAERRLAEAESGSPEASDLEARVADLAATYRELTAAVDPEPLLDPAPGEATT